MADKIIAKGKPLAADLLEASAADIDYKDGTFRIVGTDRSVSLFDVAKARRHPRARLDDEFTRTPEADTYPNGCHICEIEIDPDTGTLEIKNYIVIDDFGMALNPLLLQGQIHGGIGQGVGQALIGADGLRQGLGPALSGSFMDYAFPRADIVPHVKFDMHNSPCTTNPLGVKGAGEAGAIGAPPSVVNAIVDAIHAHTGIKHVDMPVTAASLWAAIEAGADEEGGLSRLLHRSLLVLARRGGRADHGAADAADDGAADRAERRHRADHRTGTGADRAAGQGARARIVAASREAEQSDDENESLGHERLLMSARSTRPCARKVSHAARLRSMSCL